MLSMIFASISLPQKNVKNGNYSSSCFLLCDYQCFAIISTAKPKSVRRIYIYIYIHTHTYSDYY